MKAACDLGIVFALRTPSILTIEVVIIHLWVLVFKMLFLEWEIRSLRTVKCSSIQQVM